MKVNNLIYYKPELTQFARYLKEREGERDKVSEAFINIMLIYTRATLGHTLLS